MSPTQMFNELSVTDQRRILDASDALLTRVHELFPSEPKLQFISTAFALLVLKAREEVEEALAKAGGAKH